MSHADPFNGPAYIIRCANPRLTRLLRAMAAKVEARLTQPIRVKLASLPAARDGVRSPAHLASCLLSFHVSLTPDELDLLWASFPRADGGFDWRALVAALFPYASDVRAQTQSPVATMMAHSYASPSVHQSPLSPPMMPPLSQQFGRSTLPADSQRLWHSSTAPLSPQQYAAVESRSLDAAAASAAHSAMDMQQQSLATSFSPSTTAHLHVSPTHHAPVPSSPSTVPSPALASHRTAGATNHTTSRVSRTPPTYMLPVAQRRRDIMAATNGGQAQLACSDGFRRTSDERMHKKADAYTVAGIQFGNPIKF